MSGSTHVAFIRSFIPAPRTTTRRCWKCGTIRAHKLEAQGVRRPKGVHQGRSQHRVRLVTPWGTYVYRKVAKRGARAEANLDGSKSSPGYQPLHFLQDHIEKCGDIIAIKTNIRPFAAYRAKVCYPRTTDRRVYIKSVHIHRLLSKPDEGTDMENRMMHPRQLKTWRVG